MNYRRLTQTLGYRHIILWLISLLWPLSFTILAAPQQTLHVAVASNFAQTLKEINIAFQRQYSQPIKFIVTTASTGKITTQIRYGAPFDVFFAADKYHPQLLIKEQLAKNASLTRYAVGQLALVSHKIQGQSALENLSSGSIHHLAIANEKTAPYGKAASHWLKEQSLSENAYTLLTAENVSQAWLYFENGGAEAAIVSLAQVLQSTHSYPYWIIPSSDLNKHLLEQFAVILTASQQADLSQNYLQFLESDTAKSIILKYGYRLNP